MIHYCTLILLISSSVLCADENDWYTLFVKKTYYSSSVLNQAYARTNEKSGYKYTSGFKQSDSVSWEASHSSFVNESENSINTYSLNGRVSLNSGKKFVTSLKVGVHRWEQALEQYDDNGVDLFYGLDINIPISEQLSANMNVDSYEVDDSSLNKISIEMVYKF